MRRPKSKHHLPVRERFETFFHKGADDECWPWLGATGRKGYGLFKIGKSTCRAHRVAFGLYCRRIPAGKQVLHSCDNHPCVNPAHLSSGTNQQNQDEAWQRDRKRNVRKLDPADVLEIRASCLTVRELGLKYGIAYSEAWRIRKGQRGDGILKMLPAEGG